MSELLASTIRGQKLGALSYVDGTSAPIYFGSGVPFEADGSIAVTVDGVIDHYHQGLPFTADGRLAVTLSGPPTRFGGGAAPFSASGQLVLGSDGSHYSGGIPFTATSAISSIAGAPPPPSNERYFTQLDGQSKYWRRINPDYGQTTNATIECLFYGGTGSGISTLIGTQEDSNNRFYVAILNGSLFIGNGRLTQVSNALDLSLINSVKMTADGTNVAVILNGVEVYNVLQGINQFNGLLDGLEIATNGATQGFYGGIILSARVTTDTRDDIYGLDTNLPYDLADGTTDPLADSTLIFENGSIDQSDRLLVTENAEVGFLGEDKWFDAIKAVTGQATVPTDDSITIDEVGGTLAGVAIDAPAAPITVTGDCDLISGQVDISVIPALAGVAASITQSGPFSFDLDSQGALGFKRAFSGGAQAVITNIKVKLRYDYADGANPDAGTYSSEYSNEYS